MSIAARSLVVVPTFIAFANGEANNPPGRWTVTVPGAAGLDTIACRAVRALS